MPAKLTLRDIEAFAASARVNGDLPEAVDALAAYR